MVKNKILMIISIIAISVISIGCINTEERNKREEYLKKAFPIAQKYLEEKYGFTISKKDVVNEYVDTSLSHPAIPIGHANGKIIYTINNGYKEYRVSVNALEEDTSSCYDDYEKDIINNAFKEYIGNMLEIEQYDIQIFYVKKLMFYTHMHNRFSNVVSFLKDYRDAKEYPEFIVITHDELTEDKVKYIRDSLKEIDNTRILFIQASQDALFTDFVVQKQYDDMPSTTSALEEYFNISDLYIDKYYECNTYCFSQISKKFKLDDNVYVKYFTVFEKESDYIDISEVDSANRKDIEELLLKNEVLSKDENINIVNIYKVQFKENSNEFYYIYYNDAYNDIVKIDGDSLYRFNNSLEKSKRGKISRSRLSFFNGDDDNQYIVILRKNK